MADQTKEHDNKDAQQSGRPVQLDRDEQSGKTNQQQRKPQDTPDMGHGQRPGQEHGPSR